MSKMLKMLEEEHKEFEKRKKQLEDSLRSMDEAFQKWKEEVLIFEHFEHCSDDDSGCDDWIWDGESVRPGEDEDDIQRSFEQIDRESENGSGVVEEGRNET